MNLFLNKKIPNEINKKTIFFFGLIYFSSVSNIYAATPSVDEMIKSFAESVPQIMSFVTALGYVLGIWFVFHGIILLKKYGMQRTQMSGDASMTPSLLSIFVGAALIYLPSSVRSGLQTFWTDPNPYGYNVDAENEWVDFYQACFMIIQLIGVIAFIRGLVMVTKLGAQGGGQQGGFGRAMAHIVGGIFCINMYGFLQAVFNTFGLGDLPDFG
ncbi:hypothetical protein N9L02_02270 [Gammaproteobacteria bacterium]|nr:hypothetical protein [Gammaproteobacteria bacterium]